MYSDDQTTSFVVGSVEDTDPPASGDHDVRQRKSVAFGRARMFEAETGSLAD